MTWLFLDRFQAPGWAWGVMVTLWVIVGAVTLHDYFTAEDVEL